MDEETDTSCDFVMAIKEDFVEIKEETIEVKDDLTSLEDNPQICLKEESDDLDDSMANHLGFCGEDVMFDTDNKENVKIDFNVKDEQMEEWPVAEAEYSFEDNDETEQHCQEMVESMGIIKWQKYKQPFNKFWSEMFVFNVRSAVRTNFMTKEGGASLLGIQARLLEYPKYNFPKDLPVVVQAMVDKWGIVTKKEYRGQGGSDKEFWGEVFAKNVLYAVHKDLLSSSGAAFLFGVSDESLENQVRKAYRKRSRKAMEDVNDYQKTDNLVKMEPLPENWWLSLEAGDLSRISDVEEIIRKSRINRHWFLFLHFSQIGKMTKFNPYKASMQEVAEFFHFMKLKNLLSEMNRPGNILASLSIYLPELEETNVIDLLSSNPSSFSLRYFRGIKNLQHNGKIRTLTASLYDSTWSAFVKFCKEMEENSFIEVNPFLAKPELVLEFLTYKFEVGPMRIEEVLSKPFFRPAHSFCSENLNRVLAELDWHLQYSWLEGSLKTSNLFNELVSAAHSCDERLVKNVGDLAFKLSPDFSYTKFRVSKSDGYSEDKFWNNKITCTVLKDVKSKVFPIAVAASGLGVTSEMVHSVVMQGKASEQEKIGVRDYVYLGFGSEQEFWQEESNLILLKDVRNRKISVEEIAAQFGISRKEIIEKCGGVKEVSEVEAEKTVAMFNKMKQKAENVVEVEKKTELDEKIEMLEKADWNSLSGYEKMRLKNMRERQALIKSLDFDKEKREIQALTPKNKPHQLKSVHVHQRERSARVKRRSEVEQMAKQESSDHNISRPVWEKIQEKRSSSGWFSHWVPRNLPSKVWRRKSLTEIHYFDAYNEEAIRESNHVPKFELSATDLVEISPNCHKSRILLDSFSEEFKEIKDAPKLQTKVDWDKFEVAHDCMVSASELTSLDTCDDFICFGSKCGGVGVFLAGKAVTLKPHNRKVTRTLFTGQEGSGPSILSAGLDGTVRMTDLVHQSVTLEYSWDQSYGGKQGVNWVEEMEICSFILDCGAEINQIDTRSKEAMTLIQFTNEQMVEPYMDTNLSVNPANKNMVSLCRGKTVQIWDLRNSSQPVQTLTTPGAQIMAGGGWSARGSYLVTCEQSYMGDDVPVVYPGMDWSEPLLKWESSRKTTFLPGTGVTWCPWDEEMFLITALQPNLMNSPYSYRSVVAVDCSSGAIVGDLKSGLENSTYMVHCHNSREVVVVGNSKGPGGLVVFKKAEDV